MIPPHLRGVVGEPVSLSVAGGKRVRAFLHVLEEENEKRHVLMGLAHERYHPVARPFMIPVPKHRVEELRSAAEQFLREGAAPPLPLSVWSKNELHAFFRRGGLRLAVRALEAQRHVIGEHVSEVRERAAAPVEEVERATRAKRRQLSSEEDLEGLRELVERVEAGRQEEREQLRELVKRAESSRLSREEKASIEKEIAGLRSRLQHEISRTDAEAQRARAEREAQEEGVGVGGGGGGGGGEMLESASGAWEGVSPRARAAAVLVVAGAILLVVFLFLGR